MAQSASMTAIALASLVGALGVGPCSGNEAMDAPPPVATATVKPAQTSVETTPTAAPPSASAAPPAPAIPLAPLAELTRGQRRL